MTLFEAAKTVPALDVAERYASVQAVRKGRRAWCSCPFHSDRTPSCSFDLEGKFAGRFICASCHAQGSSVDFVAKWFNESPAIAAKRICEDFRIEYDHAGAEIREKAKAKKATEHLNDEIREALAFAFCVTNGIINEQKSNLSKIDKGDPEMVADGETYKKIIEDAEIFKEALQTPKDAETAYALLTGKGVKEKLENLYRYLKKIDDETGTNYVAWYKRGAL